MNSPCRGCADRRVGCHDKCKRYKEWRKALDERNDVIHKNIKEEADFNTAHINAVSKRKARNG